MAELALDLPKFNFNTTFVKVQGRKNNSGTDYFHISIQLLLRFKRIRVLNFGRLFDFNTTFVKVQVMIKIVTTRTLMYFNTTFVKVQEVEWRMDLALVNDFNTTFVKVQDALASPYVVSVAHFNTTFVKVQVPFNSFKEKMKIDCKCQLKNGPPL